MVRTERVGVAVRGLDVVEPREREEVEPVVVVDGRFVTHPPPQGVRVVPQFGGERIPVDGGHRRLRVLSETRPSDFVIAQYTSGLYGHCVTILPLPVLK